MKLDTVLAKIRDAHIFHFQDIEIRDAFARSPSCGESLLHIVAVWGDVEDAVVLLDEGVPVDIVGEDDCTPLHHAVGQGHPEMVRLLLSRGADPRKECLLGDAFHMAQVSGDKEIGEILEESEKSRTRRCT